MKKKILKLPPHPILIPNDSTPGRHSRHSAVSGYLLRGSFPTNVKQGYSRGVKNSQQVIYNILINRLRREAGGGGRGEGWRGWGWGGEGGEEGGDEGGEGDDQGLTSRDAVRWLFHRRWTETGGGPTPAPAPRRWSRPSLESMRSLCLLTLVCSLWPAHYGLLRAFLPILVHKVV